MTPADYRAARKRRGTQAEVAALLEVSRTTIARREIAGIKITREAELALLSLPEKKNSLPLTRGGDHAD